MSLQIRAESPQARHFCLSPTPSPTRRMAWTPTPEITVTSTPRPETPVDGGPNYTFAFPCLECKVSHQVTFIGIDPTKQHYYIKASGNACLKAMDIGKSMLKAYIKGNK